MRFSNNTGSTVTDIFGSDKLCNTNLQIKKFTLQKQKPIKGEAVMDIVWLWNCPGKVAIFSSCCACTSLPNHTLITRGPCLQTHCERRLKILKDMIWGSLHNYKFRKVDKIDITVSTFVCYYKFRKIDKIDITLSTFVCYHIFSLTIHKERHIIKVKILAAMYNFFESLYWYSGHLRL
jgi:hypothetical protein